MNTNQVRSKFLEYFENNAHQIVQSSSLIPHNDPTLMFTTAGMVQFKDYFTQLVKPPYKTAASSQKCVRAGGKHNDLENVGYTARHHTFFEMLGNFSFGDYFKDRAIELAWNLLTKEFGINKEKLYITIYHDDNESYSLWKKLTNFSDDKVIRISSADNFWAMGDVGPCGPCSEIFYDHGEKYFGGLPGTKDEDGDRYVEIWNLVFMQYEDLGGGKRVNLPKPSIDTGMGLERVAAVLQGKNSNFDIDIFQKLINESKNLTGNHSNSNSHKVIADHIRSISFLVADGVTPSNEGRGYVLRRIMRRAMRHYHTLGAKELKLHKMVPTMVEEMGDAYPELKRAEPILTSILELEQNKFQETLDKGLKILEDEISKFSAGAVLSGEIAFKLYDTYGFPLDLTCDILKSKQISVDTKKFDQEMVEQKKRARASWVGSGEEATDSIWHDLGNVIEGTDFIGYTANVVEAEIKAIIQNGKVIDEVSSGSAIIILNQTPFYGESGGQVGDTGTINDNPVNNTLKYTGKFHGHQVDVISPLKVGQKVVTKIDSLRRQRIRANHSATHLLQKALKSVLGEHVNQKGSLVSEQKLRFDFSHPKVMTLEEILKVETLVNEMVIANFKVGTKLMPTKTAIEQGATALFGEKYNDEVRVVNMGESTELCGGTHVEATGDIGIFRITTEEAIASGIRRIEAITGLTALDYINKRETILKSLSAQLKCTETDLIKKVVAINDERKQLEKKVSALNIKNALNAEPVKENIKNGTACIFNFNDINANDIKSVIGTLQKRYEQKSVIIVSSLMSDKVSIYIVVSQDLLPQYDANNLAKMAAKNLKGNGGGRPNAAQAGGDDVSLLNDTLKRLIENLRS